MRQVQTHKHKVLKIWCNSPRVYWSWIEKITCDEKNDESWEVELKNCTEVLSKKVISESNTIVTKFDGDEHLFCLDP